MRLQLSRLVGVSPTLPSDSSQVTAIGNEPSERNTSGHLILKFPSEEAAMAWVDTLQLQMKWIKKKDRDAVRNKARQTKKAGKCFLVLFFLPFVYVAKD